MKTIICAQFKQETNRYAKGLSGVKEYSERDYLFGESAIREKYCGTETELGGFFDILDPCDCKLVPVLALNASPGPVTAQAIWQQVADCLLEAIDAQCQVDGILLALHGAMVTEETEDGEGELLQLLRQKVGENVPIVASLDLHANITGKMMQYATALFPYDYYPHTDCYATGIRAARCLWRTLEGEIRPVMKWKKLDLIFPFVPTAGEHFVPLLKQAQTWRDEGTLIDATICHGFFPSDIYEQGAAVITVSDNDPQLAQTLADELAAKIWSAKDLLGRHFYNADEAVELAKTATEYPIVLADVADNPGSGASTDSPLLLQKMVEAGIQDVAIAVIYDPEIVKQAKEAGVGAKIEVQLGGKIAPEITGGPYACEVEVEKLTNGRYHNRDEMYRGVLVNFGDCAVLKIGGVRAIVCSRHTQPYDLEIYRSHGITPEDMKVLIVKSAAHFRASYGRVAKAIYDVETPALGPMRPQAMPLAHSRRPIYPLDEI